MSHASSSSSSEPTSPSEASSSEREPRANWWLVFSNSPQTYQEAERGGSTSFSELRDES